MDPGWLKAISWKVPIWMNLRNPIDCDKQTTHADILEAL